MKKKVQHGSKKKKWYPRDTFQEDDNNKGGHFASPRRKEKNERKDRGQKKYIHLKGRKQGKKKKNRPAKNQLPR